MDESDYKKMQDPAYRQRAEDEELNSSILRQQIPVIRTAQEAARKRNDQAEVDRLETEYKRVRALLAAIRAS